MLRDQQARRAERIAKSAGVASSTIILAGMLAAYFALDPSALADSTVLSLSNSALPLVFAATAETVVLIGAGIDLSVGVVMSLVSVIVATQMHNSGGSMLLWTVLSVGVGCAVGLVNRPARGVRTCQCFHRDASDDGDRSGPRAGRPW